MKNYNDSNIPNIFTKLFKEVGAEVGILCHSIEEEKSSIQGVALPKGVKETSLVRVKCKGDDFKSLDTGKTVNVEKVSCTGNFVLRTKK